MPRRRPEGRLTFDDLPLFPDDAEIAEAVVGPDPDRIREWCASVGALEANGFPPRTHAYKRRYAPAVRDYYDRMYRLPADLPARRVVVENVEAWTSRPGRKPRPKPV
ncbi:hypothetical protein [Methylobacterium isbiliense]|jgi:hypothetical protein|uniref:Uncharacterized protein n=1 Tax=Methylobacterium isbiliense TaxID=315478 RepID=A0ABQ4SDL6_9HYPH|nr:hypothetical protein [Methylobacterium isbiliense]MDN3625573.1 hypothetical protein [Methylobacterium isbiliense]GJE00008.1 hypothetical protein GMJLKIPL_1926 [Methylobacterium isbiliense]